MKNILQFSFFYLLITALSILIFFQANDYGDWSPVWVALFLGVVVLAYLFQLRILHKPFRVKNHHLYLYLQVLLISCVTLSAMGIFKLNLAKVWLIIPGLLLFIWFRNLRDLLSKLQ